MTTNFIILGAIVLLLMIWTLSPSTRRKQTTGDQASPSPSDFTGTSPAGGGWFASSHSGSVDFGSSCDAGGGGCDGGGGGS